MRSTILCAVFLLAGAACQIQPAASDGAADTTSAETARADTLRIANVVDAGIAPAIAGQDGWNYSQTAAADLDSDGTQERVVITARVEMIRGQPAWDDGQPWQVYVEESSGERTYLYARRVQLGTVTMRLTAADSGRSPTVVIMEHTPDALLVLESTYSAQGNARTYERFSRRLNPTGDTTSR